MTTPLGGVQLAGLALDLRNIPVQGQAASITLLGYQCWLAGYTLTEATNMAPAVIALYDGNDATGTLIGRFYLPQGAYVKEGVRLPGWPIKQGVFLSVESGAVSGSVTVGTVRP